MVKVSRDGFFNILLYKHIKIIGDCQYAREAELTTASFFIISIRSTGGIEPVSWLRILGQFFYVMMSKQVLEIRLPLEVQR